MRIVRFIVGALLLGAALTPTATATTPVEPIVEMTEENHARIIEENNAAGLITLVKFSAPGCPPCQVMKPVIHQLAREENARRWVLAEVDVISNPKLIDAFRFRRVPIPILAAMRTADLTPVQVDPQGRNTLLAGEVPSPTGAHRWIGYRQGQETELREWIAAKLTPATVVS